VLYSFSVDAATGAIAAVPGSPMTLTLGNLRIDGALAMSPNGKFLYVPEYDPASRNQSMSVYSIDPARGTVSSTPVSSVAGEFDGINLIDPSGSVLVATPLYNSVSYNVGSYTINETNGALNPVPGSPFSTYPGATLSDSYGGTAIVGIP
jgi:6-phosphogluconolactonase (cycloisomerase 2 family)